MTRASASRLVPPVATASARWRCWTSSTGQTDERRRRGAFLRNRACGAGAFRLSLQQRGSGLHPFVPEGRRWAPQTSLRVQEPGVLQMVIRIGGQQVEHQAFVIVSVPAEFGVEGVFFRYEQHFVHWRRLSNGDIGTVTTLHERLHRIDRFREDRA